MRSVILTKLLEIRAAKQAVALITHMPTGEQLLVDNTSMIIRDEPTGTPWPADGDLIAASEQALRADKSTRYPDPTGDYFIAAYNPPKRLIIIGAVHIAQKLAPMAVLSDFDVTIIDPRGAFATPDRFPDTTLATEWPDIALTGLAPDTRTAIVTLTHDPKLDDPALAVALKSAAFYIGSLGSRRTHAARLERLGEQGFSEDDLARIHGPVGLALGAKSPAEIALSILAQMTQVLRSPPQVLRNPVAPEQQN